MSFNGSLLNAASAIRWVDSTGTAHPCTVAWWSDGSMLYKIWPDNFVFLDVKILLLSYWTDNWSFQNRQNTTPFDNATFNSVLYKDIDYIALGKIQHTDLSGSNITEILPLHIGFVDSPVSGQNNWFELEDVQWDNPYDTIVGLYNIIRVKSTINLTQDSNTYILFIFSFTEDLWKSEWIDQTTGETHYWTIGDGVWSDSQQQFWIRGGIIGENADFSHLPSTNIAWNNTNWTLNVGLFEERKHYETSTGINTVQYPGSGTISVSLGGTDLILTRQNLQSASDIGTSLSINGSANFIINDSDNNNILTNNSSSTRPIVITITGSQGTYTHTIYQSAAPVLAASCNVIITPVPSSGLSVIPLSINIPISCNTSVDEVTLDSLMVTITSDVDSSTATYNGNITIPAANITNNNANQTASATYDFNDNGLLFATPALPAGHSYTINASVNAVYVKMNGSNIQATVTNIGGTPGTMPS